MKCVSWMLGVIMWCPLLGATPKLETIWSQIKEKVQDRKHEVIEDDAFVAWFMSNVRVKLTKKEIRFPSFGLPDIVIEKDNMRLSPLAVSGQWQKALSTQWGVKGEAVYSFWSDHDVTSVTLASKKECILVSPILHFDSESNGQDADIQIYDSPITHAKTLHWAFIYGNEVLSYPKTDKLGALAFGPFQSGWHGHGADFKKENNVPVQ